MPPIITLTTDFGGGSPYVAAMKGVILSIHRAATIVDISHGIAAQDMRQGALMLDEATRYFPPDTIHVAVVDPGVGTDRGLVYARIGQQQYLAPDNGLLSLLAQRKWPDQIVRLTKAENWLPQVSATFHGRDILAPVAARLSLGLGPEELGPSQADIVVLDWSAPVVESRRIAGSVWAVDSFGNLVSNVTAEMLASLPPDVRPTVRCGESNAELVRTYGQRPAGELIAVVNSSERLELAVVNGHAAQRLAVGAGAAVMIEW